jgi:ribosomal protein S13
LYGGKVKSFNTNLNLFFDETPGLATRSKNKFIARFECQNFTYDNELLFTKFSIEQRKIFNMYFSELTNINNNVFEIIKYTMIRIYLIKTFRGRCYALGKPARGQRT